MEDLKQPGRTQADSGSWAGGSFRLRVGTVAGATDGWWSQVHHFSPADAEKAARRGEMVVLISFRTVNASGVDVVAIGRELLGRMNEEYYGTMEDSVWERLSAAVKQVGRETKEESPLLAEVLEGKAQEEGGDIVGEAEGGSVRVEEVNIAAGVLWRGAWYVAGFGRGSGAWICRGGEAGLIFGSGEEHWGGSGWVTDGDIFLLGTKRFFELVGAGVLKAALSTGSVEEAVGSLTPVVHGKRGGEGATAAVVGVEGLPDYRPITQATVPVAATMVEGSSRGAGTFRKKIGDLLGRFSLSKRSVYIRMYQPPTLGRRGTLTLGVVLLIVILGSVMFGVKRQREKDLAAGPVGRAEGRIAQARDLVSLSPGRAKAMLEEAKTVALTVQDKKKREELLAQIGALSDQASGVTRATVSTFMDLRLIRDGLSVGKSFWDEGVWWGLDTNSERLVMVVTVKKQADVVAGKDSVGGGQFVTATGGKAYVFGANGIVEVDPKQGKTRVVVATDKDWGAIAEISSFGGNLYLLDLGAGIWRYPAIEGGYGGKQRWFGQGVKPDLKEVAGVTIDGSVWVGFKNGRVLKFTQGALDSFSVPALDPPIGALSAIFTTADSTNLYLLDSESGRVIVVSKKGEYVRQYAASELKGTTGLAVDEGSGKAIYVTAGEKILEIKL